MYPKGRGFDSTLVVGGGARHSLAPSATLRHTSSVHRSKAFLVVFIVSACGGAQSAAPRDEPLDGAPDAAPSMEALPSDDRIPSDFTEKMRFAWMLAAESFELERPHRPPPEIRMQELQEWSDRVLQRWLARKNQLVEAARAELNVAAEETHPQRVWAGALVGLMYEEIARVLFDVPMPIELRREPDIARVYREVVVAQARPYLNHARRAYRACELNGRRRGYELRRWSRFCEERRARLPDLDLVPGESSTTVEVIRE